MGITHKSKKASKTKLAAVEWNEEHEIVPMPIILILSDHDQAAHDSLGIDAATLESHKSSDFAGSDVVTVHESTFNHGLLHGNSHDPSAEEKSGLAGTDGTPGAANKFVTDSDPRNSNPRIPISHNHAESEITGLVAGLQSKADLSEGKVPASELGGVGADSTRFLRGDRTWAIPPLGNNFVQVTVDFGFATGNEDFNATVTVSAPWVGADSRIICLPSGIATVDHDPEDYAVEGITAYPANIIPGVGFDIIVSAKNGTFGTYIINVIG
ncbi:MAG: hypothetical protein WCE94_02890 [Candidatus Methanoperedens sp.]